MLDLDLAAEIAQPADEAADGLGPVAASEMIGAEVAVRHTVTQHVVAGAEHGGGDGEDGLLGAAPGLEAEELGVEGGVRRAHSGPRGGDQRGLEPGCPWRTRVERRLPALSSLRGQSPAHDTR